VTAEALAQQRGQTAVPVLKYLREVSTFSSAVPRHEQNTDGAVELALRTMQ
jgi:hypothetical protein